MIKYNFIIKENTTTKLWYIHSKTTKRTEQESTEPPSKHVSSTYFILKKYFFNLKEKIIYIYIYKNGLDNDNSAIKKNIF
jgi:hypothetical protein